MLTMKVLLLPGIAMFFEKRLLSVHSTEEMACDFDVQDKWSCTSVKNTCTHTHTHTIKTESFYSTLLHAVLQRKTIPVAD